MSPLIREGNGLLRVGLGLAAAQSCCCEESSTNYSHCGYPCAFRFINGPLDSEMATCGENIPEGWSVTQYRGCSEIDWRGTSFAPHIVAQKSDVCEDSPVPFDEAEDLGLPSCYEVRSAGKNHLDGVFGFIGAAVDRSYTGYRQGTYFRNDNTGALRYEQLTLRSYMGLEVFCQSSVYQQRQDAEICGRCGDQAFNVLLYPDKYFLRAYMGVTVGETKYDSQNYENNDYGFRELTRSLYFDNSVFFDERSVFKSQTCAEKTDFTRYPVYTPGGLGLPTYRDFFGKCAVYRDFYPDSPTVFEISSEKVTVNGQDFEWGLSEETDWATDGVFGYDITPEIPSELESFDPVTMYLGKGCCTEDYCNPLP